MKENVPSPPPLDRDKQPTAATSSEISGTHNFIIRRGAKAEVTGKTQTAAAFCPKCPGTGSQRCWLSPPRDENSTPAAEVLHILCSPPAHLRDTLEDIPSRCSRGLASANCRQALRSDFCPTASVLILCFLTIQSASSMNNTARHTDIRTDTHTA